MLSYPVRIEKDSETGRYTATCREMDKFVADGDSVTDVMQYINEMFIAAIECYIYENIPVPVSAGVCADGEIMMTLNINSSLKTELYNAFKKEQISKAELARRMGINDQHVNQLFDLTRATRIDTLEAAFNVLNKKVVITVENAA